jgi:hypothetical protein
MYEEFDEAPSFLPPKTFSRRDGTCSEPIFDVGFEAWGINLDKLPVRVARLKCV